MEMNDLRAAILCGGESKRMGTDKGLIPIGNTIRAKYVAAKLEPFGVPAFFSVNEKQVPSYSPYLSPDMLIVDDVEAHGPLKGLLSVHKRFPFNNLLLLSCDLLDLDGKTIGNMLETYGKETEHEFIVYQDVSYAQPFCGIYSSGGLKKVLAEMREHRLHSFSLQSVLDAGHTRRLPMPDAKAFKNYNLS